MEKIVNVVFEDADLLVLNKPAGLVCHPTKGDQYSSLISRARLHCGGTASVHLVNRLDRETSGLVLLAKNSEVAGLLGKVWESRSVRKEYLAIVHGHVALDKGLIDQPLGKDLGSKVAIKDCVRADGAAAQTEFELLCRFRREAQDFSLLKVMPRTGRKHQIRIHLAHLGHPIVGDKIYGGDEDVYLALVEDRLSDLQRKNLILPNQALHAFRLGFLWRGEEREFLAEPERCFQEFVFGGGGSF